MKKTLLKLALITGISSQISALTISIDYTHDLATDNFFGTNATAKAALEAAASDLSNAINSSLGAVSNSFFTGTNGTSSVDLEYSYFYENPSTGVNTTSGSFSLATDEFKVFVGMQTFAGGVLGTGGALGRFFSSGFSATESQLVAATADAEAQFNASMQRGSLITLSSITGDLTLGATTASYDLDVGPLGGVVSFDDDSTWHYDHTTPVTAGASDFYSVALHELFHTVGYSSGYESFDDQLSGNDWMGQGVIDELGSGIGVFSDGVHFDFNTMSETLDGTAQEAVMDPNLTTGTRKLLTTLDLALLSDMGYDVIPEPSSTTLFTLGTLSLLFSRKRRL